MDSLNRVKRFRVFYVVFLPNGIFRSQSNMADNLFLKFWFVVQKTNISILIFCTPQGQFAPIRGNYSSEFRLLVGITIHYVTFCYITLR